MTKDLTTTVYEPIQPEGLALATIVVTVIFTILSSVIVCLRFYVRLSLNSFSVEDWLMLFGWLLNLAHNASIIVLSYSGIGSRDDIITVGMMYKMGLWTIIWQFIYVLDGALIKSSIIWTLLRVAKGLNNRMYRIILWMLFAFCWVVWQISWPVAIFQCKPVSAAWGEPGDCTQGQEVILRVSYFVSAANIFTDLATSLVPIFLLRTVQMPLRLKLLTMGVLSLGILASVATTIRITYTWAYTTPTNRFYEIGKVVMLTVLECDLGIIAGSLPMLRRLVHSLSPSYGASGKVTPGSGSKGSNLVTIGGGGGVGRRKHMKLAGSAVELDTIHDVGGLEDFDDKAAGGSGYSNDGESARRIIRVTREVDQTSDSLSRCGHVGGSDDDLFQVAVQGSSSRK